MYNRCLVSSVAAAALSIVSSAQVRAAAVTGTIFDPNGGNYTSLGTQSFTTGTLTFDTDALTLRYDSTPVGSGVSDSSASGLVKMAVFNFDSLSIGSGVVVNVTGSLGLALTSRSTLSLGSSIKVIGEAGVSGTASPQGGGTGAPGAEGGVRNSGTPASAPPPANKGNGGAGKVSSGAVTGDDGIGLGAGSGAAHDGNAASNGGGGGSYGNVGGTGQKANTVGTAGSGGGIYGNNALDDLFGGSGGGGGVKQATASGGGGGGGGGSIALIAEGLLTVSGQVSAKGGAGGIINSGSGNPTGGGGGSGGGLLLAADAIDFTGTLDASGGDGGYRLNDSNDRAGGSGAGGRIALYYNSLLGATPTIGTNILLAGGATQSATTGGTGTLFQGTAPTYLAVPEPTSAICGFALLAAGIRRRRR